MSQCARILLIGCLLTLSPACQPRAELKLESDDDKAIYAIGLTLAGNLSSFALSEKELELLIEGLRDGVLERPAKVNAMEQRAQIQTLQRARTQLVAEREGKASLEFLEKEAALPDAVRTDSGLVYRELEAGTGESPQSSDRVRVHYHGTLRDGTVFDSSVQRGTPFVTQLNGVIPCWTEGVQRMKVGGKSRLVCPADLAYRDRGAPPHIRPGAALAFDVELLEIVR